MNALMGALAVQLILYGVAWLVLALVFRLYPRTCLLWAAGWLLSAVGTALLFIQPDAVSTVLDLLVNLCVIFAFACLQQGVTLFLRESLHWRWHAMAVAVVVLIEAMRHTIPDSMVLRTWLFTIAAWMSLGPMVRDLLVELPAKFRVSRAMAIALAAPVVLTLLVFFMRAAVITYSEVTGVVELDVGSTFDIVVTLGFLVFLGLFNFSLSNLVLGSLIRRLENLSSTDQLTGLYNRRVMMERLGSEHARFARSAQTYAVIMLDLDHFKRINDTHGHAAGDAVLQAVAQRLQGSVRTTDTLARMGGEEFMVLLPLNDIEGAMVHAERIRRSVGDTPIATPGGDLVVTLSLGVADALGSDTNFEPVVSRADAALYRAKSQGRNRAQGAARAGAAAPYPASP
jgi:diguanylate cyclase (GGDEF)-like protein